MITSRTSRDQKGHYLSQSTQSTQRKPLGSVRGNVGMSDFAKLLNGQYGAYYRKMVGGKGYVFQSRFKSTIIKNDGYLIKSIEYCLQNPVRAGIVSHAEHYIWSSAGKRKRDC